MQEGIVPGIGEPIDLAGAAKLVTAHLPDVRRELRRIERTVRGRETISDVTLREMKPQEIVAQWSPELDRVLLGYAMADDQGSSARWRSVLVLVDKTSGELIVQDASGLLNDPSDTPRQTN